MNIPGIASNAGIPRIEGLDPEQLAQSLYDNRMISDTEPVIEPPIWAMTKQELESPVCQKVRAYLWAELFALREQNDSPSLSAVDTAALRGKIQAVRGLLAITTQQIPENTGVPAPNLGY